GTSCCIKDGLCLSVFSSDLIQTAEVPHQISLTVVEVGRNVTLECPVSETEGRFFYWYKQPLGYVVQRIVTKIFGKLTFSKQFNNSRFTATKRDAQYFLTITNISKEDEATYFCHYGEIYSESFNGIFLAVNGKTSFTFSVFSVKPGDSVTLQCSLLSKTKGNTDQCPGEHSVYWFRSGSGESHPGIIYTHSDEEEERSCVYSLSKTIQNSSDTGTYYCAVVTCGEILFGEGTKVETRSQLEPVVLVLGVLLACCVTVIAALIFYGNRRKVCEHYLISEIFVLDTNITFLQDGEARAMNYAALDFSRREVKRGKRKKRESPPECVYSVVRADDHNQHQPSL
uniref:Ig-like domain-containing protein n=1 Tax=Sander lucioperca TaxID=283035 RepID=A0A8D0DCT5_SANLU